MPPIVAWSIFLLLGGFFLLIATNNAVLVWRQFVLKQERTPSLIPLIGGSLGYVGLRASPVEVISNYAWLALLLDVGCGPYLLLGLTFLLPELWSTSRFNLLREYLGQQGIKTVYLRLFRRGIFTIQQHFQRPPGELGLIQCGAVGRWHRHGSRLTLERNAEGESAVFEVLPGAQLETFRQSVGFPSWESNHELSLASIDFVVTHNRGA